MLGASNSLAPSDLAPGIEAGRIVFHIDQARAYLAALQAATCTTPDELFKLDAFDSIESRVPVGGVCFQHWDCIDGPCEREDEFSRDPGRCIAKVQNGVPCTLGKACSSGVCAGDVGRGRCSDQQANGQPCNGDPECLGGECACEIFEPDQRDCYGTIGVCATALQNGCTLD